jgi:hypothetical protein
MSNENPDRTHLNRRGRKPGSRNKATLAREAEARAAAVALAEGLASETIAKLSPLETMLLAMRAQVTAGNLVSAANIAALAAPFIHGRVSAVMAPVPVPPELQPGGPAADDPPPTPNEPGPERPVLG